MSGARFHFRCSAPRLPRRPWDFHQPRQALPLYREGKVRILAVCTAERLALLPDVPALAESLPGFQATAWHGLFAPPGTPPEIVAKINAEVRKMAADPGFQEKVFAPTHFRSLASTPAELAAMLRSEYAAWKKFADDAKIKTD